MANEGSKGASQVNATQSGKDADVDNETEKPRASLDAAAQALIGAQLKAMYAQICDEPIPSDLLDLVRKFERAEGEK